MVKRRMVAARMALMRFMGVGSLTVDLLIRISMRVVLDYCSIVGRSSSGFGRSLRFGRPKVSRKLGVVP